MGDRWIIKPKMFAMTHVWATRNNISSDGIEEEYEKEKTKETT